MLREYVEKQERACLMACLLLVAAIERERLLQVNEAERNDDRAKLI